MNANDPTTPSRMYRLMIYFAHSTLVMYSKDLASRPDATVAEFMEVNAAQIKRVFDEGLSIMNYELSHLQMQKAVAVYLSSFYHPQSVHETEIYTPKQ